MEYFLLLHKYDLIAKEQTKNAGVIKIQLNKKLVQEIDEYFKYFTIEELYKFLKVEYY